MPWSPGFIAAARYLINELVDVGIDFALVVPNDCDGSPFDQDVELIRIPAQLLMLGNWHDPAIVAAQSDALRHILAARVSTEGAFQHLISTQFNLSYVFLRDQFQLKIHLIGMFSSLWPVGILPNTRIGTQRGEREVRRQQEWMKVVTLAAPLVGSHIERHSVNSLYGDTLFIRNIVELEAASQLRAGVFHVGGMLAPLNADPAWKEFVAQLDGQVCYVQFGRHFGLQGGWELIKALHDRYQGMRFLVDLERFDGDKIGFRSDRLYYRGSIPLDLIIENVDIVITSSGLTPVLWALENGKKVILTLSGSGAEEINEVLVSAGIGLYMDAQLATDAVSLNAVFQYLDGDQPGRHLSIVADQFRAAKTHSRSILRSVLGPNP